MSDPSPKDKPRREIRIPIPDLSELAAKASEKKENVLAAIGGWCKEHPLLATVLTIVLFYAVKTIVAEMAR